MTEQQTPIAVRVHSALTAANVEYAAMSWGGFNLFGDHESIKEARRMQHDAATLPIVRERLLESSRLSLSWMGKHDKLLAFIQARPAVLKELIEADAEGALVR